MAFGHMKSLGAENGAGDEPSFGEVGEAGLRLEARGKRRCAERMCQLSRTEEGTLP
jgi:hypothetical protein